MDKKYIADKRNKSKKYKSNKYSKKVENEKNNGTGDNYKSQQIEAQPQPQTTTLEDTVSNNWSRYELTNDSETYASEGADYETLLLAPISIDSHFKFKSEQNWDEAIKSQTELSKYFTLNISLLNDGVSCVPFTKRQGYDDSIVSPLELELMKKTSETNLIKYNKLLERKFPAKNDIVILKNCDLIPQQIQKDISETLINKKQNEDIVLEVKQTENLKINNETPVIEDNVDDLLNLKCADLVINDESDIKVEDPLLEKIEINKIIAPQPPPTVDLEQWLDDILDD